MKLQLTKHDIYPITANILIEKESKTLMYTNITITETGKKNRRNKPAGYKHCGGAKTSKSNA